MKTKIASKKTVLMIALAFITFGAIAQHDHATHGTQTIGEQMPMFENKSLGTAYSHYIHLKNALVASDFQKVKSASEALVEAIHHVKGSEKVHSEAAKVAQAGSLENQRKTFTALSNEMTTLVKGAEISSGEFYLEYCPMANSNTGAYWLSNEKEIRNPYFGEKMLKCGTVKEVLK